MTKTIDKERCNMCGKFIGYDFKDINIEFTPDSYHTEEKTLYFHKACQADLRNKISQNKKQ